MKKHHWGYVLAIVPLWAIGVFWGGFVEARLWNWFMAPLGTPHINFWQASGLSALFGVFLGSRGMDRDDSQENAGKRLWHSFVCVTLIPALGLLGGWIAHVNM
jgi:hypothetical protein